LTTLPGEEPVATLGADANYACGTWRSFYFILWRVQTELAACQHVHRTMYEFGPKHPEGIGLMTIVEASAPMPPAASRNELAATLKGATFIQASAVAFEGEGFRAASVRAVVTGLTAMAKQPFPHKVFAKVGDASLFLADQLHSGAAKGIRGAQLMRIVEDWRDRLNRDVPKAKP